LTESVESVRRRFTMSRGTASALAIIRVVHGQPAPDEAQARAAVALDRARLHLPTEKVQRDVVVAGPYAVTLNKRIMDEYVVWER